jgi:predicted DNA-binding protein (MmcQ/YjbR family)
MSYPLDPATVKTVIDAVLEDQPFDKAQFEFYHLNRNFFNVKTEVTTLTSIGNMKYRDNLGNEWTEQPTWKNWFHMDKGNWLGSVLGFSNAQSRKFLRDDNSPLGGEFEMIIRTSDGKRIDAMTNPGYQETYNFGRTRLTGAHKKLDVDTHNANGAYVSQGNMGSVKFM